MRPSNWSATLQAWWERNERRRRGRQSRRGDRFATAAVALEVSLLEPRALLSGATTDPNPAPDASLATISYLASAMTSSSGSEPDDHDHDHESEHERQFRQFDSPGFEAHGIPPLDLDRFPQDAFSQSMQGALPGPFPDSQTFLLHSRASATKKIYLDFNGHITTNTPWNSAQRPVITTPTFDTDNNPSTFSANEHTIMQQVWQRVSEAFSPFDVDVTTEEPPPEDLRKFGTGDDRWGIRVAIGGSSGGVLGISAGGVAFVGSFDATSDIPTFVFPDSLGRSEKPIADATIHEIGHTLGLIHDGRNLVPVEDYYSGHGTGATGWAPHMGVGYGSQLVQWSKGEYPNANNFEDDLNIITTQNGFGYRPDDYGSTIASAQTLTANPNGDITAPGVIERNTDQDVFKFLSTGPINLTISPAVRAAMLDIQAELLDASGTVILTVNPTTALNATINTTVTPGFYYVRIDGVGKAANGNDFGYSDYSSIGQYTIVGNIGNNFPPVIDNQSFSIAENAPVSQVVGTVAASDQDSGQALTYSITAGNTGNAFSINAATGELRIASPLNFETRSSYTLTVRVADPGGLSDTATVTVSVTDVNEPPTLTAATFAVAEKSPNGSVIGTLVSSDPDLNQPKIFTILSGNTGGAFAIDSTGKITVANSSILDFNQVQSFSLLVSLSDGGSPPLEATAFVSINLVQQNVPPVITLSTFNLAENAAAGTVVGTVIATDQNQNQARRFEIWEGNTDGAFAIHEQTGVLTVANPAAIDFEKRQSFQIRVAATDTGVPPLTGSGLITINLQNVNETPVVPNQNFSVVENSPLNAVVGTLRIDGRDLNQTHTYAIVDGDPQGVFRVTATGVIQVAKPELLNFEARSSFALRVRVTDSGVPPLFGEGTVTIAVTDVNEPPQIQNPAPTFRIAENSPVDTLVGTILASDQDANQTRTFVIYAGNVGQAFKIEAQTGQIRVANPAALNFETRTSFLIGVAVRDSGSPMREAVTTVRVEVTDVNDPPIITPVGLTVVENSAVGTVVGTMQATDQDSGQTRLWQITGGNDAGTFAIDAQTGRITVADPARLDFEARRSITIQVTATDSGSPALSASIPVTITITNANDAPVVRTANWVVGETWAKGVAVGTVTATDQDPGQTRVFSIVGGNPNNAFAINPSNGLVTVNNPAMLDFENGVKVFNLEVRATDNGSPARSGTGVITITVVDMNEAPTRIELSQTSIAENLPAGALVGLLSAIDPDAANTHAFQLVTGEGSGDNARFRIVGNQLQTVQPLDFETKPSLSIRVRARDQGGLFVERSIAIQVVNTNDAPVLTRQTFSLPENSAKGTVVGQVSVADPDSDPTKRRFAIYGGNVLNAFTINAATGQITVNNPAALDFEARRRIDLAVSVTDDGVPPLTSTTIISIELTDILEGA